MFNAFPLFISYFPCDPPYVTYEVREGDAYQTAMDKLKNEMEILQKEMQNSVPFYSNRHKVNPSCDHFRLTRGLKALPWLPHYFERQSQSWLSSRRVGIKT